MQGHKANTIQDYWINNDNIVHRGVVQCINADPWVRNVVVTTMTGVTRATLSNHYSCWNNIAGDF